MIGNVSLLAMIAITFLGAFSRFTHGHYLPAFYKYQLDRAPDDESTRFVPFVDAIVCVMLLFQKTRSLATLLCVIFQGIGIWMRLGQNKSIAPDAVLCFTAVVAFASSLL